MRRHHGNSLNVCVSEYASCVCVDSPWWPAECSGSHFWSPAWSCRTGRSFPPGAAGREHRHSLSQILLPKHTNIQTRRAPTSQALSKLWLGAQTCELWVGWIHSPKKQTQDWRTVTKPVVKAARMCLYTHHETKRGEEEDHDQFGIWSVPHHQLNPLKETHGLWPGTRGRLWKRNKWTKIFLNDHLSTFF